MADSASLPAPAKPEPARPFETPTTALAVTPTALAPPLSDALVEQRRTLDRVLRAYQARLTQGVSPTAMWGAISDWASHLARAPGKQAALAERALTDAARLWTYALSAASGHEPQPLYQPGPDDHRYSNGDWKGYPYSVLQQAALAMEAWWNDASTDIRGVSRRSEDRVQFLTRQMLDMLSPSNSPFLNPTIQKRTSEEGGRNLARGFSNFIEDVRRAQSGQSPPGADKYQVGRDLAVTPGKVVFRNHLMELIQYAPATDSVYAEPVLIVPAWIMKYYILDLSPHNSLVRWLTQQGHTVFIMSWRNPTAQDKEIELDDYRRLGVMAALDAISAIVPNRKIHAAGYCLGGTMLSIAAAKMAGENDDRLKSISLLAAQTDFAQPGELMLFMDESQLAFLEDLMWSQGFLDGRQMSGAFQMLRSNDLVWSRYMREYFLGEREEMNDLMSWNADQTRMPYRMHSQYLRSLFMENRLSTGRYAVDGKTVLLSDIKAPIFAVGTVKDHVAPWRSVYKIHLSTRTDVTFALTTGGHNAGIVSEPGRKNRRYKIRTQHAGAPYQDPDSWAVTAPLCEGSWWESWHAWLAEHSEAEKVKPPRLGARAFPALCDAPGEYVFQK